jgi:TPR repeat protein
MSRDGHERSDEIIGLLNIIGKRLVDSEQERKDLKQTVSDLEQKTNQNEKTYLNIKGQLTNRKKADLILNKRHQELHNKIKDFENWKNQNHEKIEKAATLSDKIEDIVNQQARLYRRIDQITQDRSRVTRKLERIEETVINTKDALEAKAMVLLTDQKESKENSVNLKSASAAKAHAKEQNNSKSGLWHSPKKAQLAIVSSLIVISFITGFAITGTFTITPTNSSTNIANLTKVDQPLTKKNVKEIRPSQEVVEKIPLRTIEAGEKETKIVSNIIAEETLNTSETTATMKDNINDYSDRELLASLEESPESLAKKLNEISPAAKNEPSKQAIEEVKEKVLEDKTPPPIQNAAITPTKKPKANNKTIIELSKDERPLSSRAKRDTELPEVIKDIEKKAFDGTPEAQHDLAAIYTAGHAGVKVNYEKAAFWFKEAAHNNVANAKYNLGVLYHQGLGIKQSTNAAIAWYKEAAKQGHPEAQYNLGIAYIEGIGTEYSPSRAALYFEEAANNGIIEAAYNLGLVHENGLLGTVNPEDALFWYKKAADQGNKEAQAALDQLSSTLGVSQDKLNSIYTDAETYKKTEETKTQPVKSEKHSSLTSEKLLSAGEVIKSVSSLSTNDLMGPESVPVPTNIVHKNQTAIFSASEANEESVDIINNEHAILAQIQEQLMHLDLYPGPADGIQSAISEDAIRSYQSKQELAITGKASEELLIHILADIKHVSKEQIAGDLPFLGDVGSRE